MTGVDGSERAPEKVCDVDGCNAWKSGDFDKCHHHKGVNDDGSSHEGNQFAMSSGLHSDPVNLFDWLADNDPDALAYILAKLHDYSERAPEPVFVADVTNADSFEDVETSLTAYGDDVLFMCIRDYARKRAQKRQLEEGLITEQTRQGDAGTYTVEDSNPVNLDLDRMDKTTMRQKDKLGLLPDDGAEVEVSVTAELWDDLTGYYDE
jgi:hypothetical protein